MNPVATSDAAFRGGACPTPEYTIAYTGNYTTSADANYLQAARMHLASLGRSIPPDLLQHLSPLGWQHINLTGDYLWTDPDAPSSALRPLRQMHAVEGPAKP